MDVNALKEQIKGILILSKPFIIASNLIYSFNI